MKRSILITIIIILVIILTFTPVGSYFYGFLKLRERQGGFSQLKFTSIDGEYTILIDEKEVGKVISKKQEEFLRIEPGLRKVKIVRNSSDKDFFYILERSINFLPSSQVEIEWESGPTLESSSGLIKYFSEISKPKGVEVFVEPFPKNAIVELDSRKSGEKRIFEIFDTATHIIKVSSEKGFEPQSFQVNFTDEVSKKTLENLRLNVEIVLYKNPY